MYTIATSQRAARVRRRRWRAGSVDPDRLEFTKGRLATINEIAPHRLNELQELDRKHAELFRDHAFLAPPDLAAKLREIISRSGFDAETTGGSS